MQGWSKIQSVLLENADLIKRKYLELPGGNRVFLTIVLFLVSVQLVITFFFGGDAWQGREANGHFFFKAHSNSPEHEVSAELFHADLWLVRTLGCLWVVGMILGIREQIRIWRGKKNLN